MTNAIIAQRNRCLDAWRLARMAGCPLMAKAYATQARAYHVRAQAEKWADLSIALPHLLQAVQVQAC
jgi:hypothetical protein